MLRTQPDPLRVALLLSLGLAGCGGRVASVEETQDPSGTNTGGGTSATTTGMANATAGTSTTPVTTPPTGTGTGAVTGNHPTVIDMPTVQPTRPGTNVVEGSPLGLSGRCNESSPIVRDGVVSGLYECDTGVVHRPEPITCQPGSSSADVAPAVDGGAPIPAPEFGCTEDSHCTDEPMGMCKQSGGPFAVTQCVYGCLSDSDCDAGELCDCGAPYGVCMQASCKSDADCGDGALCARGHTIEPICESVLGFSCQRVEDQCDTDDQCNPDPGSIWAYCMDVGNGRQCNMSTAVCGRPFLVEGEHRQAEACTTNHWGATLPGAPRIAEHVRRELADAWTRIGLMEHASIAAFARFSLQLLQLGAPPALIDATTEAMSDETTHARMAFELASHYAGRPVGPGPIDVTGALGASDLLDIVRLTIEEGCIGETIAAMEAAEAAEHCDDYAVRQVLSRIRQDELRHAELAWRFVQWAIDQGGQEVRTHVARTFATLAAPSNEAPKAPSPRDAELLRCGVVSGSVSRNVRLAVLRDVVAPCAQALLGDVNGARRAA